MKFFSSLTSTPNIKFNLQQIEIRGGIHVRHSSCVNIQLNLQFNHEYIFVCEALRVLPLLKRIFAASHHQFKLLIHYYGNVCSLFTFTASKTINIKFIVPLEMLYILIKCLLNMTIANKQR